jgi:hypothetical protein
VCAVSGVTDKTQQQASLWKENKELCESRGHQLAEKIQQPAGQKKLENITADIQRQQQIVTKRIFWTTYKQAKLNRPLYKFKTKTDVQWCSGLDMGRILQSKLHV